MRSLLSDRNTTGEGGQVGFSVGIGLTNDCNLSCAHCYRDSTRTLHITLEQIKTICDYLPVTSVGLGTGENALHPQFIPIVEYLHGRDIKLTIASNGYSLTSMPDEHLQMFHDVEVSVDFPTREAQDGFRGQGNWDLVHQAMDRSRRLGVEVSILATMMSLNYQLMDLLAVLAQAQGVNLRVNAYQPVRTQAFRLSYEQFWEGYDRLFSASRVVSCSEPVVRAAMGLEGVQSPCARHSIRMNPRGQIIPCVYWPAEDESLPRIEDLPTLGQGVMETPAFQAARVLPTSAAQCPCQGGCASRRALSGDLDTHDGYCPWVRGHDIRLEWESAPAKELLRGRNYCTTIVM